TVVYSNTSLVMKISENNGETWETKLPRTSGVDIPLVERRGQRIYVIYKNTDTYPDINFFNSSDAGTTWSSDVVLFNGQYVGKPIYMSDSFSYPSFAINGTGSASDKLYVAVRQLTTDYVSGDSYYYIKFKNSTSSGASWSSAQTAVDAGAKEVSYPSITFKNNDVYVSYFNESNIVGIANSSGSYTIWNITIVNPSLEPATEIFKYRLKLDKGSITLFDSIPTVIYPQNNGWWNIEKTIKSGDATTKAYYAQNSAGANPDSATTEFSDANYNQANTSNNVYYSLTTTSGSGYTRYLFNFSGISGTDGLSNYTIYFKGYAAGDTAYLMYKSSSTWYNFQSLTSSDSTYVFSNISTSSFPPSYYIVEFGTKQTNTSVGSDVTYVDSINITGAMRKLPDLALRNLTSSGLSDIEWVANEGSSLNSSITAVNAKYDYSGSCVEFVYANGTAPPYSIIYKAIGDCTPPVAIPVNKNISKIAIGQPVIGIAENSSKNIKICFGLFCQPIYQIPTNLYSMNFTGRLKYSNGSSVSDAKIRFIIEDTFEYESINKTDSFGQFYVRIDNLPEEVVTSDLNITIYVEADIEAVYKCWYNHTSQKCCPLWQLPCV
ncbi:MAG: hypothetical protein QXK49_03555, partial [Candidatus Aenigmatarchaeota archaeon]